MQGERRCGRLLSERTCIVICMWKGEGEKASEKGHKIIWIKKKDKMAATVKGLTSWGNWGTEIGFACKVIGGKGYKRKFGGRGFGLRPMYATVDG